MTGAVGAKPTVKFPQGKPATTSSAKQVSEGTGTPVKMGDSVVANMTLYTWDGKSNAPGGSTYDTGAPELVPVSEQLPKVIQQAFVGAKPGGRFYAVVASDSFTKEQLDQAKAQGADTSTAQVFVVDVIDTPKTMAAQGDAVDHKLKGVKLEHPGGDKAPVLTTKTDEKAPKKLVAETVIKGDGEKVKSGQTIMVQYTGKIWGTDSEFDSSWKSGRPALFQIGTGKVIKGWDEGLVGVPVGSRVLLSIPPALGYGDKGQGDKIKGDSTLVFAVDVIGAY
ncbi:FKBP-type peptidyl-prolyl cis-trans isomerase [Spongiactinospora sp. TRM90649]|uniref:FKBP-type peptidyl-prolyl cis-trans isomerase n=1 Tax=Spongiactinospora sp. TRM90649 TaxID=3031114 RepID=UPI0023F8DA3B|nr:FKBP-type peptidyl-prolyl cis-trans isomerase [Spongiactinospora sp. TRM90649]MDF5753830.1 FKBP-type peptidyl-prolyl cis-trans isomerase [Spongiactinospora sp. TRM90649]